MCVVLVPKIGLRTTISNTTQICPQHFRNFMCVLLEYAWCQCQILALAPAYQTVHKYAHSSSETSCVSTGNACGTIAKYQYQNNHVQHYTNIPTTLHQLHVCPLGMCVVLVPNIGISTNISKSTQMRPQCFRNLMRIYSQCTWCQCQILVLAQAYPTLHKYSHSTSETSCVSTWNVRGASAKYWSQNHHIQQKTFSPQHFRNFMCVHWECVWCQCQILVLEQAYPILHKYAHSILESSCLSTGNVRGASTKYWSQNHHIQHHTNTPTALDACANTNIWYQHHAHSQWTHMKILKCCGRICVVLDMPVLIPILPPVYSTIHKYAHSSSETSCVSTGNVRGGNAKYWSQNHHIQHYTNPPTVLQKLHVCPLGMCVVLVQNICISTSISNTTQIRPQNFRIFMCVHWECAWCQYQILVLEPPYPTLH